MLYKPAAMKPNRSSSTAPKDDCHNHDPDRSYACSAQACSTLPSEDKSQLSSAQWVHAQYCNSRAAGTVELVVLQQA